MRIVYCLNSVSAFGGISGITIAKANALSESADNQVYIVVTDGRTDDVMRPISQNVNIVNLNIDYYADDWKSRWHVLKGIVVKRVRHRRRLKKLLFDIQPDVVVSVGQCEKNMVASIRGSWATVREFHYPRNYRSLYAGSWFDRFMALAGNVYDAWILGKYDSIVVLTEKDRADNWGKNSKITVVPNYTDIKPVKPCNMSAKRVMAAGRLEREKGFDMLIDSWAQVSAGHPDWTLDIFGDGSLKGELQDRIDAMGLSGSVTLCPATSRIADEYAAHSVFVLSSRYEGFCLVLLEAMTCGMACVSFDCPACPSDMIEDRVDGLLVEYERLSSKERVRRLSAAISYMIEHPDERERMAGAAIEKSRLFSRDKVMSRWDALFRSLMI